MGNCTMLTDDTLTTIETEVKDNGTMLELMYGGGDYCHLPWKEHHTVTYEISCDANITGRPDAS